MFVSNNPIDLTVPPNGSVNFRSRRMAFPCSESHPMNLSTRTDFRISGANCWPPVYPRENETLPQQTAAVDVFRQRCAAVGITTPPGQSLDMETLPVRRMIPEANSSPPASSPDAEETPQHLEDHVIRHSPLTAVDAFRQRCAAVGITTPPGQLLDMETLPVRRMIPEANSSPPASLPDAEETPHHLEDHIIRHSPLTAVDAFRQRCAAVGITTPPGQLLDMETLPVRRMIPEANSSPPASSPDAEETPQHLEDHVIRHSPLTAVDAFRQRCAAVGITTPPGQLLDMETLPVRRMIPEANSSPPASLPDAEETPHHLEDHIIRHSPLTAVDAFRQRCAAVGITTPPGQLLDMETLPVRRMIPEANSSPPASSPDAEETPQHLEDHVIRHSPLTAVDAFRQRCAAVGITTPPGQLLDMETLPVRRMIPEANSSPPASLPDAEETPHHLEDHIIRHSPLTAVDAFRQRCAAVGITTPPGQLLDMETLPVRRMIPEANSSPPASLPDAEETPHHLEDHIIRHSPLTAVDAFRQRCAAVGITTPPGQLLDMETLPVRRMIPEANSSPPASSPDAEETPQHLEDPDTNFPSTPAGNRSTVRRGAIDFCTTPFRSPDVVATLPEDDPQLKNAEKYSEVAVQLALSKIRSGELTVYKASKNYGVPRSTLQFRLSDQYKQNSRPGPPTVLTADEEKKLVKWIFDMQKKGFPVTAHRVQLKVAEYVNASGRSTPFKDGMPGKTWLSKFFDRHPDIAVRTPEGVSSSSAVVSEVDLRGWFTKVLTYAIKERLMEALRDPSRKINGDEIGFYLYQLAKKVLAKKGSRDVIMVEAGDPKKNITVLFSFSADGYAFPPDVILPYERIPADIIQSFPGNWGLGKSQKGWMDAKNFMLYIEKILYPDLVKRGVTFPVIFFVDGHSSHTAFMAAEACIRLGIVLVCLQPNSTRIIQPADVGIFGPLKTSWRKILEQLPPNESVTITTFADHLQAAMNRSFKPETIKSAFRACGLHPFDQNAVNYNKALGKSSDSQKEDNQQNSLIIPPRGPLADESNLGHVDPNVPRPAQVIFESGYQADESFRSSVDSVDGSDSVLGPADGSFSVQTFIVNETNQLDLINESTSLPEQSNSTQVDPANESFPDPAFFVNESFMLENADKSIQSNETIRSNESFWADDFIQPNDPIMTSEAILPNDPIRLNEIIRSNEYIRPNDSILPNESFSRNEFIQVSAPNDSAVPVVPLQDSTNTRRCSISDFLTFPPTPKPSERMEELQAIQQQKEQAKKQKIENARKREEKKVARIVEKNKREENKIRKQAEKQEWLALKETLRKRKLEEKIEKQEAKKKAKKSPNECYVPIR